MPDGPVCNPLRLCQTLRCPLLARRPRWLEKFRGKIRRWISFSGQTGKRRSVLAERVSPMFGRILLAHTLLQPTIHGIRSSPRRSLTSNPLSFLAATCSRGTLRPAASQQRSLTEPPVSPWDLPSQLLITSVCGRPAPTDSSLSAPLQPCSNPPTNHLRSFLRRCGKLPSNLLPSSPQQQTASIQLRA